MVQQSPKKGNVGDGITPNYSLSLLTSLPTFNQPRIMSNVKSQIGSGTWLSLLASTETDFQLNCIRTTSIRIQPQVKTAQVRLLGFIGGNNRCNVFLMMGIVGDLTGGGWLAYILGYRNAGNNRPEAAICHNDDSFILHGGLLMTEPQSLISFWTAGLWLLKFKWLIRCLGLLRSPKALGTCKRTARLKYFR